MTCFQSYSLRAIPYEYTWGVERSPIKKSWGEGVKIKKIIGRGVCQILENMGRRSTPHVFLNGIALTHYHKVSWLHAPLKLNTTYEYV